jgi:photosystem II stability/assembly factor-like uncharacterized protein
MWQLLFLALGAGAGCGGGGHESASPDSGLPDAATFDGGNSDGECLGHCFDAGGPEAAPEGGSQTDAPSEGESAACAWSPYNDGLSGAPISSLLFDARSAGVVYAAGGSTCYQSTDSGQSWHARGALSGGQLGKLAPLGGTASDLLAASSIGVVISHDAGQTWTQLALDALAIRSIAIDRSTALRAYAGVTAAGVFRSDDGGASWSAINGGYPSDSDTMAIDIDPTNPDSALSIAIPLNASGGWTQSGTIMKTTDGGASWSSVLQANDYVFDIQRCSSNSQVLYATAGTAVARSSDGGQTWTSTALGANVLDVAITAGQCDDLYVLAAGEGPMHSVDGGTTFGAPLVTGLELSPLGTLMDQLVVDPQQPGGLLLGSHGGVFRSADAGTSWALAAGLLNLEIRGLASSPLDPSSIWLSTWGSGTWLRSANAPWSRIPVNNIPADFVFTTMVDPYTAGRVLVGTWSTLYESTNAGASFTATPIQTNAFAAGFDPTDPKTVYVGTQVAGVYKSLDGAMTWATSNGTITPWQTPVGTDIDVGSLVVDPSAPQTIYIGTSGQGVYKSTDGAGSWTNILAPSGSISCLVLTTGPTPMLYACVEGEGIERSTDGGTTWEDDSTGLPSQDVGALVSDGNAGDLYVVSGQAVYVQRGTAPWAQLDDGCLPGPVATALVIGGTGTQRQLLVGSGGGVYSHAL